MLIVSKFWTRIFSFGKAHAVTVYPFIFLSRAIFLEDKTLLNHERIHLRQALELGIIFFYLWYLIEFLVRLIQQRNFRRAYLRISFEREAYSNEQNQDYLKNRSFWEFRKYITKKSTV
ncbi:hypothetical protein [Sphingobacterium spiritivorum]|uniref:hypothetical protein n=1 Tax=Sphingobacterium spiritivorum TaxID=258 RepID=UPI0019194AE5|nr:hypothetical protein [Sphingobacterium spiritivorum]QQT28241.1 hypothetical protein I6J02_10525 [Sphingobacterium spiritivorum]